MESARAVLAAGSGKAEPVSASTTALFERIMANHSPAAVQGGVPQTSADGDADVKMLMRHAMKPVLTINRRFLQYGDENYH